MYAYRQDARIYRVKKGKAMKSLGKIAGWNKSWNGKEYL